MDRITRRTALRGALAAAGVGTSAGGAAQTARPNIVFILADDLGYGHVGPYGQKMIRTPHIDRLAAQGTRFSDVYAGCSVCGPCRSVLMTGLHMGHTPVRGNGGGMPLAPNDITIAQVLKDAGYRTGMFGKWGLGAEETEGIPTRHGFEETFGYLHQVHAHIYYPEYLFKNDRKYPLPGNENHQRKQYSHDLIAEETLRFIRRHKDERFFCYAPFTLPHAEYLVPEDSLAEYRGKFEEPDASSRRIGGPLSHFTDQPYPRAAYAAMVTRLDRDVGRILAVLKELNLEQNTVVFFTSDNGTTDRTNFFKGNGPFRGMKSTLYEGGLRVPMIVRWPGKIAPDTTSDFPWMFQDVMPTLAELAGARAPRGIDGTSVVPALLGRQQQKHEFLYWEMPTYDGKLKQYVKEVPVQAVRMGDWKAVRPKPNGALELYDLREDIGETRNVAEKHPAVMARIEEYLKTARIPPRQVLEPDTEWWTRTS